VPIEHLRLLSSIAIGHCDAVVLAMHNTPFTDVNDNEYTVHESGYEAIDMAERVLALLSAFVQAVRVDEAAVRRHVESSCATMTELADSLVREEGLAFGEAHEICSHLARSIVNARGTLATAPYGAFVDAFRATTGRAPRITEAAFRTFATPEHFVAVRTRPGGPAPAPMDQSLAGYRDAVECVRATLAAHHHRIDSAAGVLSDAAGALQSIPTRPATEAVNFEGL
jgi:argininosuccinate lyase